MDISNLRSYLSREYFFEVVKSDGAPFGYIDLFNANSLTVEIYIQIKDNNAIVPAHAILRKNNGDVTAQYINYSKNLYIAYNTETGNFQTGIRDQKYSTMPTYEIYLRILGDAGVTIIMSGAGTVSSHEHLELQGENAFSKIKVGNWLIEQDTSGNLVFKEQTSS